MPELPEVEHFRQILLPLVSNDLLSFQLLQENPPRKWQASIQELVALSNKCYCVDVMRKGKLLCMVLEILQNDSLPATGAAGVESVVSKSDNDSTTATITTKYLFLHMGMTGRVTAPGRVTVLENVKDDGSVFPPPYSYLMLQTNHYPVALSDPRKFSSLELSDSLKPFDELAEDALQCDIDMAMKLCGKSTGVKAMLLDQKRVVSGVGNWVADEVLYQLELHPDQTQLTNEQARNVLLKLQEILQIAIDCLNRNEKYPDTWLFNYRWTKKKASTDFQGRPLTFLQSGGRTSATVASIQRLNKKADEIEMSTSSASGVVPKKRAAWDALVNEVVESTTNRRTTQRRRTKRK
jgi:formamidopyrimidine-DNA glycosylase